MKHYLPPLLIALLAYLAYLPAFSGGLFYDDISNLAALSSINDLDSAIQFAFGGNAGPTGRPLALLTFLLHAGNWPNNASLAIQLNFFLHLANSGLLALFGYRLLLLMGLEDRARAYRIALSATALWLVMPLLASTTLIPVQRMTGLAAFFTLTGLLVYLHGFTLLQTKPRTGLSLQCFGLLTATCLAFFSKENGALTPLFALVLELTVATRDPAAEIYARFRRTLLTAYFMMITAFLAWAAVHSAPAAVDRGFTVIERLQTQVVILWQYLWLAFLPKITAYGPFHDDIAIATHNGLIALATAGLIVLVMLSLRLRARLPLLMFAALWFLAGHWLESTTLMLELYYEHRNYLGIYGFCLLIAYMAWQAPGKLKKFAPVLLAAYIATLWGALLLMNLIWGDRPAAAENWARNHPASTKAALHLSSIYYQELQSPALARSALKNGLQHCKDCLELRIQSLLYACGRENSELLRSEFLRTLENARHAKSSATAVEGVFVLRNLVAEGKCPPITVTDAAEYNQALLHNPAFHNRASRLQGLYFFGSLLAYDAGDIANATRMLDIAESIEPSLPIIRFRLHLLLEQRRKHDALMYIDSVILKQQTGTLFMNLRHAELEQLRSHVKSQPADK